MQENIVSTNNFWTIIVTSTVVATFISSIVSIVISRLQYKDTLRLNRYSKKWDLSIEIFKNLQAALLKIDNDEKMQLPSDKSNSCEDDIFSSFIVMFTRSKEKMTTTKTILEQISYLIPKEKANHLFNEYSKLEESYTIILASAYHARGLPQSKIRVNIVSEDELPTQVQKYIDNTKKFSDELKNEIINALRDLFGT